MPALCLGGNMANIYTDTGSWYMSKDAVMKMITGSQIISISEYVNFHMMMPRPY